MVASVLLGVGSGRPAQLDFEKADAETVRLKPSEFPGLPDTVRADLEQRGCTVPQPFIRRGGPANVVRGRFMSAAPIDVAVLCSRARRAAAPDRIGRHGSHRRESIPDLDHDGIEDAFLEKGSSIWYWFGGRWLELSGAD